MSAYRNSSRDPVGVARYTSPVDAARRLDANLVARRLASVTDPADRRLIWFFQLLSHRPGGLQKVADDLLAMFPERCATASMQKFGMRPGQIYNAAQVRAIRKELPRGSFSEKFPIQGEWQPAEGSGWDVLGDLQSETENHSQRERRAASESREKAAADKFPNSYPATVFQEYCRNGADDLAAYIEELCLNPSWSLSFSDAWYFPKLNESLREFMARWIEAKAASAVTTSLGKQVHEELDYALQGRCLVLIDGLARTGKTFSAQYWCELHPGEARFLQVPSGGDEQGFFRAIAKALGLNVALNTKAEQLRDRIEDVLQSGDLCLVMDEAHLVWPSNFRHSMPRRLIWILTALVNSGVPVAFITTPQFLLSQRELEKKTAWNSDQFAGRIGHYRKLPDSLPEEDLAAVAKSLLPEGDRDAIDALVLYAQASTRYLAAIEAIVKRARF